MPILSAISMALKTKLSRSHDFKGKVILPGGNMQDQKLMDSFKFTEEDLQAKMSTAQAKEGL